MIQVLMFTGVFIKDRDSFIPSYFRLNARVSGALLNLVGEVVEVKGRRITSPDFSVTIKRGCGALDPAALFFAAIVAFPSGIRPKLLGLLLGLSFLFALNQVRIMSLYFIGVYFPEAFDTAHVDIWQAIFVVVSVALWAIWARFAMSRT